MSLSRPLPESPVSRRFPRDLLTRISQLSEVLVDTGCRNLSGARRFLSMPRLVRVSDVAHELGVSISRLRQLADSGAIPSQRSAGGHRVFDLGAVRRALALRA